MRSPFAVLAVDDKTARKWNVGIWRRRTAGADRRCDLLENAFIDGLRARPPLSVESAASVSVKRLILVAEI